MTIDEAKKIVLKQFPHAEALPYTFNGINYIGIFRNGRYLTPELAVDCKTERAAWLSAAERILKEKE